MPLLRALPLVVPAVLLVATGCGGTEDAPAPSSARTGGCEVAAGTPAPTRLVERLDLGDLVTWTDVQVDPAAVNAVGVAPQAALDDVLDEVQDAARAQGWDVFSLDDEGFEAEVLARSTAGGTRGGAGSSLLGVVLREGACEGQVDVSVSVTDVAG